MSKRGRRAHRHRRRLAGPPRLLDRILATPHLAHVVPKLQPEVLHRVIQHCGLEDCGELVALVTPGQLARLFDLDLWRPAAPGRDEQFDAGRFASWLEVMMEAGAGAAATLAAADADVVAAGLAQHVRVFDQAAVAPYITLDGQEVSPDVRLGDAPRCEVGGYVVAAARTESWDAISTALIALADAHGEQFDRIMRRCCGLSSSRPEVDGLDDLLTAGDQAMFDLATDREARRDTQGYVPPAQARAFLQASRRIDIRHGAMPPRDAMTQAFFREDHAPVPEPPPRDRPEPARDVPAEAVAAIVDLLHEAGVMPREPRALLPAAQTSAPRLGRIQAQLQFAYDHDPDVHAARSAELAYLANVIAAGSTIQSRVVAAEEASRAAVAVCNLGLENWPAHWLEGADVPPDFLIGHDLVRVFQVGWTVLHEDVCMFAADRLLSALTSVQCSDADVRAALATLRIRLTRHWRAGSPWECRDALEVIAILDTPSWAALHGFIDECPTLHAVVDASLSGATRQVDATAFEFISENAQIRTVHAFLQRLPGFLHG